MRRKGGSTMRQQTEHCDKCYGFGLWAKGFHSPIRKGDVDKGNPTIACPHCKANANPLPPKAEKESPKVSQKDLDAISSIVNSIETDAGCHIQVIAFGNITDGKRSVRITFDNGGFVNFDIVFRPR